MHPRSSLSSNDSGFEEVSFCKDVKSASNDRGSAVPSVSPLAKPGTDQLPSIPLSGFTHSLVPDMVFGWRPKNLHGGPIPLIFNKRELPEAIDPETQEQCEVVYHGFRPRDSMVMHRTFSRTDGYPIPTIPALDVYEFLHRKDPRLKELRAFLGMNPHSPPDTLVFDSKFESGNLDKAVRLSPSEYDLYMRADANTRGYHQWYYFAASSLEQREVRLNIVNFTKNESLYNQGMLPLVRTKGERTWRRDGFDVKYSLSKLNSLVSDRKCYFSLSFSYRFRKGETVYFAYALPYTYSQLYQFLAEVSSKSQAVCRRETLCTSLSGIEVPLLTISSPASDSRKEFIIVTARVHPGETHGSWVVEVRLRQGLIRFLVSEAPAAEALRNRVVFLVAPCLNPDGVIMGNYRTSFSGQDLNRQFESPDPLLHPSIFSIKKLLSRIRTEGSVLAYIDLHAHSKKKSVFIYGPHFPLHSEKYYGVRVLPKVICDGGEEFRYTACRFKNEVSKQKAARLVIWKQFGLVNSYTVEASFHGFLTEERTTQAFNEEILLGLGTKIGLSLLQYVALLDNEAKSLEEKRKARKKRYSKPFLRESPPASPSKGDSAPTLDSVINSIKASEDTQASDPGSESSSGSELIEDQLLAEDQDDLHEEITHIMEEFTTLAAQAKRPITKLAKYRGKIGRVTPDNYILRDEDSDFSRSGCVKLRRKDTKLAGEGKQRGSPPSLFGMTEVKSTRSFTLCRKKGYVKENEPIRAQSKSPLVDTRRGNNGRGKREAGEERLRTHPRSISPVPVPKSPLQEDEEPTSPHPSLFATHKVSVSKTDPQRSARPRLPVTRPVSILPHVPALKSRPLMNLSRKLSQIFAKAKVLSSECS